MIIVYDTETKKPVVPKDDKERIKGVEYAESWDDYENMGVSVICVWDYGTNNMSILTDEHQNTLQRLVDEAKIIVGWNIRKFDNPLLKAAMGVKVPKDKCMDLKQVILHNTDMKRKKAKKVFSLDNVMRGTLGYGKVMPGYMAPVRWQRNERNSVVSYCVGDVLATKGIFERMLSENRLTARTVEGEIFTIEDIFNKDTRDIVGGLLA